MKGSFEIDDAVEIAGLDGRCSPRASCASARSASGTSSAATPTQLPEGVPHEVVHRDDLVVLP